MCNANIERGQVIADNIRKILLNCDLRILHAEAELKIAQQEHKLHSKLGSKNDIKKSLLAKARAEAYKIYIKTINEVKGEVSFNLNQVLSRYTPKYKKIWTMYFIEQASIDDICTAVAYSRGNVNKIIQKLKLDLCHHYNGDQFNGKK